MVEAAAERARAMVERNEAPIRLEYLGEQIGCTSNTKKPKPAELKRLFRKEEVNKPGNADSGCRMGTGEENRLSPCLMKLLRKKKKKYPATEAALSKLGIEAKQPGSKWVAKSFDGQRRQDSSASAHVADYRLAARRARAADRCLAHPFQLKAVL